MSQRLIRNVSEREIAIALILEFVESEMPNFSLMGFYDDDFEFLNDLAERLQVAYNNAFVNKLRKVVRTLVNYNVLYARMAGTSKEYFGEPAKQMDYWLRPGKAELIRKGKTEHTMSPEDEVSFLLRHAYPDPFFD